VNVRPHEGDPSCVTVQWVNGSVATTELIIASGARPMLFARVVSNDIHYPIEQSVEPCIWH
jgi:hypothetical protein